MRDLRCQFKAWRVDVHNEVERGDHLRPRSAFAFVPIGLAECTADDGQLMHERVGVLVPLAHLLKELVGHELLDTLRPRQLLAALVLALDLYLDEFGVLNDRRIGARSKLVDGTEQQGVFDVGGVFEGEILRFLLAANKVKCLARRLGPITSRGVIDLVFFMRLLAKLEEDLFLDGAGDVLL